MNPLSDKGQLTAKIYASILLILGVLILTTPVWAKDKFHYQMYTDIDNHGVVVFPKGYIFEDLDHFIKSLGFKDTESGVAVFRFGSVNRNATYMMPEETQKKYNVQKFVILQVLEDRASIMVGIWEQEHGLTLPSAVFRMDDVRNKLPQTLDIFRKQAGKKPKTPISYRRNELLNMESH